MTSRYTVNYHFAAGLQVTVSEVEKDEATALQEVLKNPDAIIVISGRDTHKAQYIPVRNLLLVELVEE